MTLALPPAPPAPPKSLPPSPLPPPGSAPATLIAAPPGAPLPRRLPRRRRPSQRRAPSPRLRPGRRYRRQPAARRRGQAVEQVAAQHAAMAAVETAGGVALPEQAVVGDGVALGRRRQVALGHERGGDARAAVRGEHAEGLEVHRRQAAAPPQAGRTVAQQRARPAPATQRRHLAEAVRK